MVAYSKQSNGLIENVQILPSIKPLIGYDDETELNGLEKGNNMFIYQIIPDESINEVLKTRTFVNRQGYKCDPWNLGAKVVFTARDVEIINNALKNSGINTEYTKSLQILKAAANKVKYDHIKTQFKTTNERIMYLTYAYCFLGLEALKKTRIVKYTKSQIIEIVKEFKIYKNRKDFKSNINYYTFLKGIQNNCLYIWLRQYGHIFKAPADNNHDDIIDTFNDDTVVNDDIADNNIIVPVKREIKTIEFSNEPKAALPVIESTPETNSESLIKIEYNGLTITISDNIEPHKLQVIMSAIKNF